MLHGDTGASRTLGGRFGLWLYRAGGEMTVTGARTGASRPRPRACRAMGGNLPPARLPNWQSSARTGSGKPTKITITGGFQTATSGRPVSIHTRSSAGPGWNSSRPSPKAARTRLPTWRLCATGVLFAISCTRFPRAMTTIAGCRSAARRCSMRTGPSPAIGVSPAT